MAILNAASVALERGSRGAAVNQLEAFQNKVRTQIAPADPALADALLRIGRDPVLAQQLSRAGRKIVREKFDGEKSAGQLADLFRQVMR